MKRYHRPDLLLLLLLAIILFPGCSVQKLALKKVAGALTSEGSTVFSGDEDPELVGDALPFALKTYESLLQSLPEDDQLLKATGSAFCMYAYAYVQLPADMMSGSKIRKKNEAFKRAKKLYLRGRGYLLRALEVRHPGFNAYLDANKTDSAIAMTTLADTSLLYWTGLSWMGAFSVNKFDMKLAVSTTKAVAMMKQVLQLNESFGEGAIHEFFISYLGGLPASMGGSKKKAREHYARALELSKGMKAGPHMALATAVCIPEQNVDEFKKLMKKITSLDLDASPANRLQNILAQRKAKWYLSRLDTFFLMDDEEDKK